MIKIKRIDIFNYRSCIKTKVDIITDLTTLIGVNGVGKSNILNGIQLLKRINRNRYFHQKELIDTLSHTRIDLQLDIDNLLYHLKSVIYYDTNENNTEEIYSADLKIKDLSNKSNTWINIDADLYEYVDYINRTGKNLEIVRGISSKSNSPEELKFSMKVIMYLTNISYYSATQFSDPTKCPISLELEDLRLKRSIRSKVKTHDQFIYDLYRTYTSDHKSFNRYINTVNQNGIGLIDDITFLDHDVPSSSYKVKAGGKIQKIEKTKKIIVPSILLDNLSLSPNQLSEGTFKTLALVFYILNHYCPTKLV